MAILTGHCVLSRHAEIMPLPFNDICRGCRPAEEHFLCQSLSVARCIYGIFTLTKLSSIVIMDIASFIKLSGWCSRAVMCFKSATFALINFSLLGSKELGHTAFNCGVSTVRNACSSELLISKLPH